jgi:hypothetical protein
MFQLNASALLAMKFPEYPNISESCAQLVPHGPTCFSNIHLETVWPRASGSLVKLQRRLVLLRSRQDHDTMQLFQNFFFGASTCISDN